MKRFLINLDTLLDTRLGSIARYSQEAARLVISNPEYKEREHDNWELFTDDMVSTETFNKLYAERGGINTQDTINGSVLSGIIPVMHRFIGEELATHLDNSGDNHSDIMLTVDIHPYNLDTDAKDTLIGVLAQLFGEEQEVELINVGIAGLTPTYIFENFALIVMYDMHEWLRCHYEEMVKMRAATVNFIGPKLFEKDVSHLDVDLKKRELLKFKMDHLVCMNFEFINAEYFSVIELKK